MVLAGEEGAQAFTILGACRAALEVRTHARMRRLRVGAGELELDVAVEPREALLAADLGLGRTEDASRRAIWAIGLLRAHVGFRSSYPSILRPRVATLARSLFRASCRVL
jgi:hypothetical protein